MNMHFLKFVFVAFWTMVASAKRPPVVEMTVSLSASPTVAPTWVNNCYSANSTYADKCEELLRYEDYITGISVYTDENCTTSAPPVGCNAYNQTECKFCVFDFDHWVLARPIPADPVLLYEDCPDHRVVNGTICPF
jgi:hypothetical protein